MNKKSIITHVVAMLLGLLGGFLGRDLSGFQKPAEAAAEQAVEKLTPVVAAPVVTGGPAVVSGDAGPATK